MANEKKTIPQNTITRDLCDFAAPTGNIYETVVILSKRANQISVAEKKELSELLEASRVEREPMEEVMENTQQMDIAKRFDRRPKPALRAIAEFENSQIFYEDINNSEDNLA